SCLTTSAPRCSARYLPLLPPFALHRLSLLNGTAPPQISTLSLHDALPICDEGAHGDAHACSFGGEMQTEHGRTLRGLKKNSVAAYTYPRRARLSNGAPGARARPGGWDIPSLTGAPLVAAVLLVVVIDAVMVLVRERPERVPDVGIDGLRVGGVV